MIKAIKKKFAERAIEKPIPELNNRYHR